MTIYYLTIVMVSLSNSPTTTMTARGTEHPEKFNIFITIISNIIIC